LAPPFCALIQIVSTTFTNADLFPHFLLRCRTMLCRSPLLSGLLLFSTSVDGFTLLGATHQQQSDRRSRPWRRRSDVRLAATTIREDLKQQPGENEAAYMKRLTHLASSADALMAKPKPPPPATMNATTADGAPPKKSGYVRAEDWDAEHKARPKNSWEERVQFDGLKVGSRRACTQGVGLLLQLSHSYFFFFSVFAPSTETDSSRTKLSGIISTRFKQRVVVYLLSL
jgi:hypothetical protein